MGRKPFIADAVFALFFGNDRQRRGYLVQDAPDGAAQPVRPRTSTEGPR